MTSRIQPWRRRVHLLLLAVFVVTPFLRMGGESLLRFDVPTLRLHAFGTVVRMDEFFVVLLAVLAMAFFFIWLTVVYGRIWCGWLCPQTLLVDLTGPDGKGGEKARRSPAVQLRTLAVSIIAGAVSVWYFVSPYDFFNDLAEGRLGPVALWAWLITALLIWLDLVLIRYSFCATVCPYSRLQGVMFDRHTLAIAFDDRRSQECIDCTACLKACPVGIDIREGLQAACVNCTECIDTCARVMERKKKKSLVGFFFGGAGGTSRLMRPVAALPLAAAAFFFALFLVNISGRPPLEAMLTSRHDMPPRRSPSGFLVNSYELSIENRSTLPLRLSLSTEGGNGEVRLSPGSFSLEPDEHRRVPLTLQAAAAGPVDIILEADDGSVHRLKAAVRPPEF